MPTGCSLVVDFMDRAQDQEIRINGFASVRSDVFEKIVVYKTHFGHILETNPFRWTLLLTVACLAPCARIGQISGRICVNVRPVLAAW